MANLREHVDADQDDGNGGSSGGLLLACEEKSRRGNQGGEPERSLEDAGRLSRPAGMRRH